MKVKDLTYDQVVFLCEHRPEWMIRHRPKMMAKYCPEWVADNHPDWMIVLQPEWMDKHRPEWVNMYRPVSTEASEDEKNIPLPDDMLLLLVQHKLRGVA